MFRGVWPVMATPFRQDESLDLDGFRKAITFMAAAGADGVTISGVLGESNRLTDKEREALIVTAVDAARTATRPAATATTAPTIATGDAGDAGTLPAFGLPPLRVCVGTSHAGTFATVSLSQMAMELGADGVMVTPTKEPAPHVPEALIELYAAVGRGCPGLPIVLQDHPASTQVREVVGREGKREEAGGELSGVRCGQDLRR
jgi:4-hydroxy-tetrahydrodipicolinate synthase